MNTTRFLRSAIAVAIGTVAMVHVAHADIVSSASVSVDNLRYRLIDLAPDDGIAPSITFHGAWSAKNVSYDAVDVSMIGFGISVPQTEAQFLNNAPGHLFSDGSGVEATVSGDIGYVSAGSTQFSAVSVLQSDRFTTAVQDLSHANNSPGWDEQGNAIVTTTHISDIRMLGAGRSEITLGSHAVDGALGYGYEPTFQPSTFTLSANTILVLEGSANSSFTADRSSLIAAQNLLPPGDETGESWSVTNVSATGLAVANLEISLTDGQYFGGVGAVSQHGASFYSWRVLSYNEQGFQVLNPDAPEGIETVLDPSLTASQSFNDDIKLVYANVDGESKDLTFYVRAVATTDQTISGNHFAISSTTAPAPVPEPGTYAMMGLGLVGMMMLRRRREFV